MPNPEEKLIELLVKLQTAEVYRPVIGVNEAGFLFASFAMPPELAKKKDILTSFYIASDEDGETLETILAYALGLLTGEIPIPENMRYVEPPEGHGCCQ
jgi:hypothetical protein